MQYVPGHGFRAVPSLPKKPVRGMPSLKGKLKKKPDWEPPKPKKKKATRRKKAKTTRTARVSAAPKKKLPKMKKRGWFW